MDARQLAQRLGDRPERDPLAVGEAAAAGHGGSLGDRRQELARQPRLSRAGNRLDRHQAGGARLGHGDQLRAQGRELLVAADQRCGRRTPHGGRPHAHEPERRHRLGLALELERLDRLELGDVRDQLAGERPDQHLVRAGGLLEARGDVDGVAGDEPLPRCRIARDDLAGVDAGAVLERDAEARVELGVQSLERGLHPGGGAHRPLGVVLVQVREAEDRHHGVADELLDGPAVALELAAHHVEVARHHGPKRLRVEPLADRGRADEVREDDRDRLSDLACGLDGVKRRAAEAAQAEAVRVLLAAARADCHAVSLGVGLAGVVAPEGGEQNDADRHAGHAHDAARHDREGH